MHSETGAIPAERYHAEGRTPATRPDSGLLRRAFLWREQRRVTATATVSLHGNRYEVETIKERYQLDDDEALAVLVTVRLYEQILDVVEAVMTAQDSGEHELAGIVAQLAPRLDPTPSEVEQEQDPDRMTVRATLEFLADPAVAAAVLAETSSEHDHSAIGLGVFAESAESLARARRARHCDGCGPRPTSASVTSSRPRRNLPRRADQSCQCRGCIRLPGGEVPQPHRSAAAATARGGR